MECDDLFSLRFQNLFAGFLGTAETGEGWMLDWIEKLNAEFPDPGWHEFKSLAYDEELTSLPQELAQEITLPDQNGSSSEMFVRCSEVA
jgi:hypothetical protein